MNLIITDTIYKDEFGPLEKVFDLEVVKAAARKSLQGLGDNIKNSFKVPSTKLSKIYLTGTGGAGRAIFLLKVNEEQSVLVMIRTKKDKQIGSNMTIKNPKFQKVLEKNLSLILSDLARERYSEYKIG